MAKARIGHFVESQILQECGVDYIDESEVLTPADEQHHSEWFYELRYISFNEQTSQQAPIQGTFRLWMQKPR